MKIWSLLRVASAAFFIAGSAFAQNPGAVSNHAFPIGKGPGTQGFGSLVCNGFAVGTGSSADPTCRPITYSDLPSILSGTSFTTGLPLIGNGTGPLAQGTKTGNTNVFATSNGALTANDCVKIDAGGNLVDAGATCGANANTPFVQDFLAGTNFTAGTTTTLTLSSAPSAAALLAITFDGVVQSHNTWSLAGAVVTFNAAIPANTQVVEAHWYAPSTTAGVGNLNALSGALNIVAGQGIGVSAAGSSITVKNTTINLITAPPYNAVCDGVTDNTGAIQAAIDAIPSFGGIVSLPTDGSVCAHASPLNFRGRLFIRVVGGGTMSTAPQVSNLLYTGTASRAYDLRDSYGTAFEGVNIGWSSAAFNGILIDAGGLTPGTSISSYFKMREMTVGPSGSGNAASVTCVNVSETIIFTISRNSFISCGPAIHGQNILGQSTTGKIERNLFFQSGNGWPIQECGDGWSVVSNTFEQKANGLAAAFSNSPSLPCRGISWKDNWYGDVTVAGGTWFNQVTAIGWSSINEWMASNGGANGGYYLIGGSGYTFSGGYYVGMSFAFQCDAITKPTGVQWNANTLVSVAAPVNGLTNCLNASGDSNTPNFLTNNWTPTFTPTGGAAPAAINSATYKRRGNKVDYDFTATFGTVTGTVGLAVGGLPITPTQKCVWSGNDLFTSQTLSGTVNASASSFSVFLASDPITFPVSTGSVLSMSATCSVN